MSSPSLGMHVTSDFGSALGRLSVKLGANPSPQIRPLQTSEDKMWGIICGLICPPATTGGGGGVAVFISE